MVLGQEQALWVGPVFAVEAVTHVFRYVLLPLSPGRTLRLLVPREGLEPPTP